MKVWITKYALTSGIIEGEAEQSENRDGMISYWPEGSYGYDQYFYGKDWHKTKDAAVARAEEMRIKKLQSLDKQVKKISALVF